MFVLWDPSGVQRTYDPGVLRRRQVERVAAARALAEDPPESADSPPRPSAADRYGKGVDVRERREPALTAGQIMSAPVITLSPSDPLDDAQELFRTRRFRHVPVISSTGEIIGVLSDRDLLFGRSGRVGVSMATPVLTARPRAPIRDVAQVLIDERIGSMPIVDEEGVLVGILTRSDILRAMVNRGPFDLWV